MNFKCIFTYKNDNVTKQTSSRDNDDFSVDIEVKDNIINAAVKPKKKIEFETFEIVIKHKFTDDERIFTNGYQSWTVSKEYHPNGRMDEFNPRLLGIQKKNVNPLGIWGAGDLTFHKYPEQNGVFYGYTYGYIRKGSNITLMGSLSERAGYTVITYNTSDETITIGKDLEGVVFDEEKTVLTLAIINDEYDSAFDEYFRLMDIAKPRVSRKCGYTTWYNYYTNVTEDIVKKDLDAISALDTKIDIFQIDDGYERTVGDWLITDEKKFPDGMKVVADSIHNRDMLAGLWLAPFAVTPKSYIYKEHKDWLVRDKKGRSHYASHNWGGFYALDIYNDEVREYIRSVFDTVLNEWGYDMVKLDFLYACSIIPVHNKSRGEIMCEAMDFLRECCGDKIILGCGVPLGPAFGKVDFCRIGADVGLCWENKAFSREDVSTQNTLTNTMFRRHLDGRAFLNDPDVFLLRDDNIKMPLDKRKIVAKVNSLFGNLLFVSDNVSTYNKEQMQIFVDTITCDKAEIVAVNLDENSDVTVDYVLNGEPFRYSFNLKTGDVL